MKATIVIPAFNAAKTISRTLTACTSQSMQCQIIVVDDGSTDTTPDIVAKFPVKYLRQNNKGPAAARNLGWRAAEGEIILFTDSDCVPERDWARTLISLLETSGAGAAGGTYTLMNPESLVASCIHYEIQHRHSSLPGTVRYLGSFSMAVQRSVLELTGGFDESFRIACGEDTDLSYRISGLGKLLKFTPDARTGHFFPTKTLSFLRQQFWRGYWIMKLVAKHPGKLGNDDYSGKSDAMQPPLFFSLLLLAPFCLFTPVLKIWLALNALAFLLNVPAAAYAVRKSGSLKLAYTLLLLYLRGFCWALGCTAGTIKFMVKL